MDFKKYAPLSVLLLGSILSVKSYSAPAPAAQINTQTWLNLCNATSQGIIQGCYPDCGTVGTQQYIACQTILEATGVEAMMGITNNQSNGMYVMGFLTNALSSGDGPVITNNDQNNSLFCSLFSTSGQYIPPGNAPPFNLAPATASSYGMSVYNTGTIAVNSYYYLICQGAMFTNNVALNISPTVSASWPSD